MSEMLVKLYDLPAIEPYMEAVNRLGMAIRRPVAPEKHVLTDWVRLHFTPGWVSEAEGCFIHLPVSCFVAIKEGHITGFSCYETTMKNFFGPFGVDPQYQGNGIGKALLLKALYAMREMGYAYSIIGFTGVPQFYSKFIGAQPITGSGKSYFDNMLW